MRILKAVYNRAVENGLTGQRNLFKSVYTGVEKTLKRAIHLNDIRRIKRLDLSLKPHLDLHVTCSCSAFTRGCPLWTWLI